MLIGEIVIHNCDITNRLVKSLDIYPVKKTQENILVLKIKHVGMK